MKIITIVGARPQFIKAATVSRAIKQYNATCPNDKRIHEIIVHTGQHYDINMSEIFFKEMEIPEPNYNLEVGSGNHGEQTGKMLSRIEEVLLREKPDMLLVYGDTNSTLAGALAAVKLHIPSVHVEAGLRSCNRHMPEEINRIMADHAANILMCPTRLSVENLKREGITNSNIKEAPITLNDQIVHEVGDVMYDSFLFYTQKAEKKSTILQKLNIKKGEFILATVHRAENTDNPTRFQNIMKSFQEIASPNSPLILPLHPRSRKFIEKNDIELNSSNVLVIDPVGYIDMVQLEKNAGVIITDSGGVQKEAFFAKIPCITLRDQTEWTETINMGWNCLTGDNPKAIGEAFALCRNSIQGKPPFPTSNSEGIRLLSPYGDGRAAEKIVNMLSHLHT